MKLVSSSVGGGAWDDALRAAGGSVFHSSGWAKYVTAMDATAAPQFIRLESSGGEPLGHALAFRKQSSWPVLAILTGRFWLETTPVTHDPQLLLDFLRRLELQARDAGAVVLEVGSYAGPGNAAILQQSGFTIRERLEFVLPLDRTADQMWNAMDDMRRRNIRRGGRLGVTVEELPASAGVGILRQLQRASFERITGRGGHVTPYDGDPTGDPLHVLAEAGVARIFGAREGAEWLSATLVTSFNGRAFYMLAGHSRRSLELQAGSVLIWECLKWYRAQGDREFNLGGCPAEATQPQSVEHGVYRYKSAFGAKQVRCASGTKTLRPARLRLSRAVYAACRRFES